MTESTSTPTALTFFENAKRFFGCRKTLSEYWDTQNSGILVPRQDINVVGVDGTYDASLRQQNIDGQIVQSIPELYLTAQYAKNVCTELLTTMIESIGMNPLVLISAPLKGQTRAAEKALDDYSQRVPGPGIAWLFDIVRASIECENDVEIASIIDYLLQASTMEVLKNVRINVVRLKNRFIRPTPGGFRDINMNICVDFLAPNRTGQDCQQQPEEAIWLRHICELQIHLRPLKALSKQLHSHDVYSYFRSYFRGSDRAVEARLQLMEEILGDDRRYLDSFVAEAKDLESDLLVTLKSIVDDAIEARNKGKLYSLKTLLEWMNEKDEEIRVQRYLLQWEEMDCGPDDVMTVKQVNNLGALLAAVSQHEEAHALYTRAYQSYSNIFGPNCDFAVEILNNMGALVGSMGNFLEAIEVYERALKGFETLFGPDHERTLILANNLGVAHRALGQYDDSERYFRQCLAGRERIFGPHHNDTLMVVSNLCVLLTFTDRLEEALAFALRAVDGNERLWGPEHGETLGAVHNLGMVYGKKGMLEEAKACYIRAMKGRQAIFGSEALPTLSTMNNLACLYESMSDLSQADDLLKRVLDGYVKILGSNHPTVMTILTNCGRIQLYRGQFQMARDYFQRAADGRISLFGEIHNDTLYSLSNLAKACEFLGDYQSMSSLLSRVIAGRTQLHGELHPKAISAMQGLADSERAVAQHSNAIASYRRLLEKLDAVRSMIAADDDTSLLEIVRSIVIVRVKVGFCLGDLGDIQGAVNNFSETYDLCLEAFGDENDYTYQVQEYLDRYRRALAVITSSKFATLPREILHSVHQHPLSLGAVNGGMFNCDSCGQGGVSVRYCCKREVTDTASGCHDVENAGCEACTAACDVDVCMDCCKELVRW